MELPRHYNENRLVLMVQEPTIIFSYWELSRGQWESLGDERFLVLRLYTTGSNRVSTVLKEVSLPPFTNDWYFRNVLPEHTYHAELGYYGPEGEFYPLLRSNKVVTPRTRPVEGMVRFLKVKTVILDTTNKDTAEEQGDSNAFWGGYSSMDLVHRS
ncbi:DUF4912 domain-containing protein [Desulfofundulus thermosubterraneus]|uniref:DUF4912 domain-containing protein n=1 Tax=Desulfofundulus thermosubterraneus DSM 16057 TaxID=1121432 RepID=A0A1M6CB56_9FIRM|nr:DUF4912 domain-containing protein [Desulfofundulus thermosubterraneus]SHI58252.1 hypothetical protein SAMN02745219_00623 [Desulfofundulus thermosubterraneus DSM 16057]